MSSYQVGFDIVGTADQVDEVHAVHKQLVAALADAGLSAQETWGVDGIAYRSYVVGEGTGDHLDEVRGAFEAAADGFEVAVGKSVSGLFSYVDDQGQVTNEALLPKAPLEPDEPGPAE